MLILTEAQVRELLDLDALVDAMAAAMVDATTGAASMPQRIAALVPDQEGMVAAMPAFLPSAKALAVKLVSLFPRNAGSTLPTHQGVIVAFDPDTGTPVALMDAIYITAARTAAGSALATRLLARPDAAVLAVLGSGSKRGAMLEPSRGCGPFERSVSPAAIGSPSSASRRSWRMN